MAKALVSLSAGFLALVASAAISAGKPYSVQDVKGRYTFSFYGEVSISSPPNEFSRIGPIAASGYLIADGNGSVTQGERTLSTPLGIYHQTFTCSLSVESSGAGTATCSLDPGVEKPDVFPEDETYSFAINGNRESFRLVGTTAFQPSENNLIVVSIVGDGNR